MNVTSGWSAATAFTVSSVGPQVALSQKAGVAKATTKGSPAARASAIEVS